ncbi:hypothetical protein [Nonomuraea sp. NPDC049709]|uniref:hypothetical protein n=1 Tax=Nonomuraea sp. NPDC049709 TaxID=3154736 RepID=UPI00342721AB
MEGGGADSSSVPTTRKAGWIASVTIPPNQPFNAWLILQPKSSQPQSCAPPSCGAGSDAGTGTGTVGSVPGCGCGGGVSIGPVGIVGVEVGAGVGMTGGVGSGFDVGEGTDGGSGSAAAWTVVTVSVMAVMVMSCARPRLTVANVLAMGGRGGGWRVTVRLRRCL